MIKRRFLRYGSLAIVVVMVMGLLVTGCGQTTASSSTNNAGAPAAGSPAAGSKLTLKVGFIDSFSGPAAAYTAGTKAGLEMAADEVAKAGGPKLDIIARDDAFKVDQSLAMAKELVMNQNVDVLVGIVNSAAALAVAQYANDNKVPFIDSDAMSEKITGQYGGRYVFGIAANTAMIGKAGAYQLAKLPYTRYWLAGSDYEYGRSVVNSIWSNLQKQKPGVQKVGESWWKVGESDFSPYINAIRAANPKPDAVYVGAGGADTVAFLKAVQDSGLNKEIPVIGHNFTDPDSLRPLGLNAPEGVYGTATYFNYFPDTPANKAFGEAYKQKTGVYPGFAGLYGYLTGKLLGAAVEKAGSTDKEKIIDAMEGLTLDAPVGKVTMRKEDHQLMLPLVWGRTVKSGNLPYLITDQNVLIPADEVIPPVADVLATRKNKK